MDKIKGIIENYYEPKYNPKQAVETLKNLDKSSNEKHEDDAIVYEQPDSKTLEKYKVDTELLERLKNDAEKHLEEFRKLVKDILLKQVKEFDFENGTHIKRIFTGIEVDEETRKKAEEEISENGYWGVTQTSQRIFDFAKALTGGDPEKMENMRKAFEDGFDKATKQWGDELPDICQETYKSVQKLFDDYKSANAEKTTE